MAFGEFPIGLRASIYRVHPFKKILCGASIVVIPQWSGLIVLLLLPMKHGYKNEYKAIGRRPVEFVDN
jgi:hypothetical protein